MKVVYIDTSAAMKLVIEESETDALVEYLESDPELLLVSSWLLHTELHCASGRHPEEIPEETVREVLDPVELADLTRRDLIAAGRHSPLRSSDAMHLAAALRIEADVLLTYDREMAEAAERLGVTVVSPGQ